MRNVYKNDTYTVYQLLLENRRDFRENTYDEFIRIRNEHFASFLSVYNEENIRKFIDHCVKIESDFSQGHIRYEIVSGFGLAMSILAENKPEIYKVALGYYLRQGEKINIHPLPLVKHLMKICGKEETYNFIYGIEHPNKRRWLFGFYQNLQPEEIRATDLSALYSLFQESDQTQIPNHLDFLLNYSKFDERFIAKVAQLILNNCEPLYSTWILNVITNPYSEIHKHLETLFKDDIDVLKNVYLTAKSMKDNDDYNSATLSKILDMDFDFIVEYIEWLFFPKSEKTRWQYDTQDYTLLWKKNNYREIFIKIVELVYEKERKYSYYTTLNHFFIHSESRKPEAAIEQKQEELLTELISRQFDDVEFIKCLFEVIAYFPQERRYRLISTFLKYNKNLDDFQDLTLEPPGMSWSGSAVPVIQERIDYLKSLFPMMQDPSLLEHRVYIQQLIDYWENRKSEEKKRDFMGADF